MKKAHSLLLGLVGVFALGAGALVDTAEAANPKPRKVPIKMVDVAFDPASLNVSAGERITFVFTNRGKSDHDAFVGDAPAQKKHEREMRKGNSSEHDGHGGGSSDAVMVKPGRRATLTRTFKKAGTYQIGCHQEGHYTAGMKVLITVA